MAAVPFWTEDDGRGSAAWNRGVLGPHRLPGRVTVEFMGEMGRHTDRQKSKGKSGGPLVDHGYAPTKIRVDIHYTTKADHAEWQRILPQINPRREGAVKEPFEFKHASVDEVDIREWCVTKYLPGKAPTAKLGRTVSLILEEYFPETKKAAKGTGTVKQAATAVSSSPLSTDQESIAGPAVGMSLLKDPTSVSEINSMLSDLSGMSVQ